MEGGPGWVPYSQRPEWADMRAAGAEAAAALAAPRPPVVAIQYREAHREALGLFNACAAKGDRSARMLGLTADVVAANSAHYTAWQCRWEVLQALGGGLEGEEAFTQRVADDCAKNYQLWNHRRKMAKALGPEHTDAELRFCEAALDADAKNYHAWAHRQVVVAAAARWEGELGYVERLLRQDVRNNSAWNQRFWLLQHTLGRLAGLQPLLDRELEYVASQLARAPDNESAWNYLAGLFTLPGCPPHEMGRQAKVHTICREALSDAPSCKPALDVLSLFYEELARAAEAAGQPREAAAAAARGLAVLGAADVADPMRACLWRWRRRALRDLAARAKEAAAERAAS